MVSRTGIGAGIGIPFRNMASGGGKPYLSPEVKEALKAVVIACGKTNNDSDRAVVKNLVDADNPFIISNAAYKLNSGYGKYSTDFLDSTIWNSSSSTITSDRIDCKQAASHSMLLYYSAGSKESPDIPSFQVIKTGADIDYSYIDETGTPESIRIVDGINTLPASHNTLYTGAGHFCGFGNPGTGNSVTLTQVPSYQGAFVTDGIDDMITSTKTVQKMLGGSNEITVVSMAHFIKGEPNAPEICRINQIRRDTRSIRNSIFKTGKSGIFGYTYKNGVTTINNILGDRNDCTAEGNLDGIVAPFSVEGYYYNNNSNPLELCSIAWYWTIIANKVLTADQINQVIAYFNLDRTLNPDILCYIGKQGITNGNHAEFGDKLTDFSGNGRDIQLNNIAWKGDSGIGKYETDFLDSSIWKYKTDSSVTSDRIVCNKAAAHTMLLYYSITDENKYDVPSFNVLKQGDASEYYYIDEQGTRRTFKLLDGINTLPASHGTLFTGTEATCGFGNPGTGNSVTITQIPSHAGGLCLDGVNDFGKVTGMPVYKDYTIIADYERFYSEPVTGGRASVLSKSSEVGDGSFIFNLEDKNGGKACYTFGEANGNISDDITRIIRYQSKYYNTKALSTGTAEDNDFMVLGKVREADNRYFHGAVYSLMSFPYSMSGFLIERQLKKHKLGTLYPDMVEFRPIVTYDKDLISKLKYFHILKQASWVPVSPGDYLPDNAEISFTVDLRYPDDKVSSNLVFSNLENVRVFKSSGSGNSFDIRAYVTDKSPQKINITIDEYIRYEDIVQPYPVLLRFKDENGNEVSWGGKFKVGSNITRTGSIADPESNLLNGLYSISGLSLNGKAVTGSTSIVEKQMVFKTTATYLLDNNEPDCILSPRLLRIPNSSYKILGCIPDISGHGNHGKISNSAYAGMSGADGYVENFTTWGVYNGAVLTDNTIKTNSSFNPANSWVAYKRANTVLNSFSVNITGIPEGGILNFRVNADTSIELSNGRNDLSFDNILITVSSGFRITKGAGSDWSNLVIQQIGEYEGAYCLDGVDDFITVPVTVGGKQVLMKVNSFNSDVNVIYDQRLPTNIKGTFAVMCDSNPAYSSWNTGQTYIDGVLNKNITGNQLVNITHNLTITNDDVTNNNSKSPFIGKSTDTEKHAGMSLYDFMLFNNISTDDKIKGLNEYVGIEGSTEWRKTE